MPEPRKERTARELAILKLAEPLEKDGELEIDDDAVVSEGEDNGAYIQTWVWVSFAGTPLDKEPCDYCEKRPCICEQEDEE